MESSNLIKRQMKLIEKRLQRYNLEDILFWLTIQQLFSTYQLKHSFCEIIAGLSIKNWDNSSERALNFFSKRLILFRFRIIVGLISLKHIIGAFKLRKANDKIKHEYESEFNLKFKYLFYRGDGFVDQLIEVADSLYLPLDKELEMLYGFSYACVKQLFIYIYKELYNNRFDLSMNIKVTDLEKVVDKGKLQLILNRFSINNSVNTEYDDLFKFNEIYEKPLIVINGNVYAPVLSHLFYNLPKFYHYDLLRIDKMFPSMSNSKELKDRYTNLRGSQLEKLVCKYLLRIGKEKYLHHEIFYEGGEADVVYQTNNTTLLIEVKSKLLTMDSYKGNLKSIQNDFKKGIQDAYNQAYRTQEHIRRGKAFWKESRNKSFLLRKTRDFIKICLTGENFSVMAIELNNYIELKDKDSMPLSFNIYDFEHITSRVSSIIQLVDYFEFRLGLFGHATSIDEIDIFEAYMSGIKIDTSTPNSITVIKDFATKQEKLRNKKAHEVIMGVEP